MWTGKTEYAEGELPTRAETQNSENQNIIELSTTPSILTQEK